MPLSDNAKRILSQIPIAQNFVLNPDRQDATRMELEKMRETAETDKLNLRDIANQAGDTELRKRVGLDVGPMTQEQTGLSGAISKSLMDNPEELAMRIPASQAQKFNPVLDMLAAGKKLKTADAKNEEWDRRFDKQTGRMEKMQGMKEDARSKFITPKTKADYRSLGDQITLAENIKSGLESAIANGMDVTGIITAPVTKIKEILGTVSPEQQKIITDLRLNFADFVRERGGTAFTETEKQVFSPIVPEMNRDEKTNLNRIKRMIEIMRSKQGSFQEQYPGLADEGSAAVSGQTQIPQQSSPAQTAIPQVGEVRKGYQYKGGDPAAQSSWVRLKQ
jgi:hypothetical protein